MISGHQGDLLSLTVGDGEREGMNRQDRVIGKGNAWEGREVGRGEGEREQE